VFVSQTVKDLVAGSGLVFEDCGEHERKGDVLDRWRPYRVVLSSPIRRAFDSRGLCSQKGLSRT
jgi:hypothetical protein